MNSYQEKLENRRQRYLDRASKAAETAARADSAVRRITDNIPFGQPILVGHHSERHARADQRRIERGMEKMMAAESAARHYRSKADSVGQAGISSDDPEAVELLTAKLANLENLQQQMVAINKIVRRKPKNISTDDKLKDLGAIGVSPAQAATYFEPDFAGRAGIPAYALSNNNAQIQRVKQRIEQLQAMDEHPGSQEQIGDITIVDNADENRVQIIFPAKPDDDIRQDLRQSGFRWSRTNGAWQRNRGKHSMYSAREIARKAAEA